MIRYLIQGSILAGIAYVLITSAWLRENATDTLPQAAAEAGVMVPLAEPRIVATVSRGLVELFDGETLVKRYPAGFGRAKVPGMLGVGRDSTPLGDYIISRVAVREEVLARGSRWLEIDFPSDDDAIRALDHGLIAQETYESIVMARRRGERPPCPPELGGPFGIQGNFFPVSTSNCTDGSIALSNADVIELWKHAPVGTVISIVP